MATIHFSWSTTHAKCNHININTSKNHGLTRQSMQVFDTALCYQPCELRGKADWHMCVVNPAAFLVQSSAKLYQHSPTAAVHVYLYLTINGFLYSAFPEYSCLAFSTPCNIVPLLPFPALSTPAFFVLLIPFSLPPRLHFGAVVSFPVVSCLAFSTFPFQRAACSKFQTCILNSH